jgi:hypothetical protein
MARCFLRVARGLSAGLEAGERSVIAQVAQECADLIRVDLGVPAPDEGRSTAALDAAADSEDPLQRLEAELASDRTGSEPHDPAVRRLFPPAVRDDPERAAEFRRLSQSSLVRDKIEALECVVSTLDRVPMASASVLIDEGEAALWLRALADMRLVLAERMGIRSDSDLDALRLLRDNDLEPETSPEDTEAGLDYLATVYEFLSWLQETLIDALD